MEKKNVNQQTEGTRNNIEARIIAKAWKDESYKQELLTNSKEIFEREFSVNLSPDVNVTVMEENASNLYIVLPECPDLSQTELSEDQLEAIAGGFGIIAAVGIGVGATFVAGAVDGYLENH